MRSPSLFIGFMGDCGSGKTTLSRAWAEAEHPGNYKTVIYADPLKEAALAAGWSGKKDQEGRAWLQDFSDRFKREHGQTVFLDIAMMRATEPSTAKVVVFEDVRFNQEIVALHRLANIGHNVALLYIKNDEAIARWKRDYDDYMQGDTSKKWTVHPSELEWRMYVATTHNPSLTVSNSLRTPIEEGIERIQVLSSLCIQGHYKLVKDDE